MICKAISCHDVVMLNRTRFQFWVIHVRGWQPKGQMVIYPVGAAIMSHCVLQSMSFLGCLFNARSHWDHSHLTSTRPPLDVRCFFFQNSIILLAEHWHHVSRFLIINLFFVNCFVKKCFTEVQIPNIRCKLKSVMQLQIGNGLLSSKLKSHCLYDYSITILIISEQ